MRTVTLLLVLILAQGVAAQPLRGATTTTESRAFEVCLERLRYMTEHHEQLMQHLDWQWMGTLYPGDDGRSHARLPTPQSYSMGKGAELGIRGTIVSPGGPIHEQAEKCMAILDEEDK